MFVLLRKRDTAQSTSLRILRSQFLNATRPELKRIAHRCRDFDVFQFKSSTPQRGGNSPVEEILILAETVPLFR